MSYEMTTRVRSSMYQTWIIKIFRASAALSHVNLCHSRNGNFNIIFILLSHFIIYYNCNFHLCSVQFSNNLYLRLLVIPPQNVILTLICLYYSSWYKLCQINSSSTLKVCSFVARRGIHLALILLIFESRLRMV